MAEGLLRGDQKGTYLGNRPPMEALCCTDFKSRQGGETRKSRVRGPLVVTWRRSALARIFDVLAKQTPLRIE